MNFPSFNLWEIASHMHTDSKSFAPSARTGCSVPTIPFNRLASLTSIREAPKGSIKRQEGRTEGCSMLPRSWFRASVACSSSTWAYYVKLASNRPTSGWPVMLPQWATANRERQGAL